MHSVADAAGDAKFEAGGMVSGNLANLDILGVEVSQLDALTLQITMTVADLTTVAPHPSPGNTDSVLVWHVQWLAPSQTDPKGGKNFFVYMESVKARRPRSSSARTRNPSRAPGAGSLTLASSR